MKSLRTHGKSTIVWLLMGMLVLGLGGFGVTSFSGGSTQVGAVGGTAISADDYARVMRSQLIAYQQRSGQPVTMAQAQAMGLPQAIQAQLFIGAALEEQARVLGVSVGDQKVAQAISSAPAFQGPNGRFDRTAYGQVLRREGLSEAEFEAQVRVDEARMILQRAVTGAVAAPAPLTAQTTGWLLESRDFSLIELTEDLLPAPVADPDEDTLIAWHKANADQFTAPESRRITYVWLTPELLADAVELDEAALRAVYDQRRDEYHQPERRMVARLVFPSAADAEAAKAQLDAGQTSFADLVAARGLTLDDIDLGELSQAELGQAGDAIFALDQPDVVGPLDSDLGPALFAMNAILEPVDISFEEARDDLRSEAALDRAARMIEDQASDFEDMLVGGATLEDMVAQTPMQIGQIDWNEDVSGDGGSIAGYPSFRDKAAAVTVNDFPQIERLEDGGIFALRLDEVVPPALIPLEKIRDEVAADWHNEEVDRQLLALAREERVQMLAAADATPTDADPADADPAAGAAALAWQSETGVTRDGWLDGAPAELIGAAFRVETPDEIEVVNAEGRVFMLRLDAVRAADLTDADAQRVGQAVAQRLGQSLQADLFDYYAQAAQARAGIELNQQAINAINARIQ